MSFLEYFERSTPGVYLDKLLFLKHTNDRTKNGDRTRGDQTNYLQLTTEGK